MARKNKPKARRKVCVSMPESLARTLWAYAGSEARSTSDVVCEFVQAGLAGFYFATRPPGQQGGSSAEPAGKPKLMTGS